MSFDVRDVQALTASPSPNPQLTTLGAGAAVDVPPDPSTLPAGTLQFQPLPSDPRTPVPGRAPVPVAEVSDRQGTDPLAGLTVDASIGDRQRLATALATIGATSIGRELLDRVRDQGLQIRVLDDSAFDQVTGGKAPNAAAVYARGGSLDRTLLVRSPSLTERGGANAVHVIAHELTHAAQHAAGEGSGSYARLAGPAAARLGAQQLSTADTLVGETGAELVASAIDAQHQDPARFAQVARQNLDVVARDSWDRVSRIDGYNPQRLELAPVISPTSASIVRSALGSAG